MTLHDLELLYVLILREFRAISQISATTLSPTDCALQHNVPCVEFAVNLCARGIIIHALLSRAYLSVS